MARYGITCHLWITAVFSQKRKKGGDRMYSAGSKFMPWLYFEWLEF
jgi:hypothetical protein